MTKTAWRIAIEAPSYSASDMSGAGAKVTGGRWNHIETSLVYCSENISLATLETLSYARTGALPFNRYLVRIDIPSTVWSRRETLKPVPGGWDAVPSGLVSRNAGDHWQKKRSAAILIVPSVIVPEERNLLINPQHPDAALINAVVMRKWIYDVRLF